MNSLCIPRAMTYTTGEDVGQAFNTLFGNSVMRVDERTTTDRSGEEFKMFYIHFQPEAGLTPSMRDFNEKLEKDGVVHVMTGRGKWFWKVYLNKSTKVATPIRKGPRVMTEEDEKLFLEWKASRNGATEIPVADIIEETAETTEEITEETIGFTEEELDELDEEFAAAQVHAQEDELMAIADEMANE